MNTHKHRVAPDMTGTSRAPSVALKGRMSFGRGLRAATLTCALLVPATLLGTSHAATQPTPFQGSFSVVAGRNVAGPEGASYRLPGGIVVSLSANCDGSVIPQPQMLALKSGKRTPTYSVFLNSGRVEVTIPSSSGGAVAIAGPASVRIIGQRGTISALASGRTMYAYSPNQALLVSQKERLSTLQPGVIRQFSADASPVDRPALKAPTWTGGRHVWLAIPAEVAVSDFTWSEVAGAHAYAVQLIRQDNGQAIAQFLTEKPHLSEGLPRLAPGKYAVVVRAVDQLGLAGLESAPFRIQVVGVDVPPGATLKADRRIELRPTQTIQLNNADGLLMTRSREREKRPANEPVGVADGKPTPVMIHDADADQPSLVWLLPSKVPIVALAGPKWVVWPQQSVTLEVLWSDALGNRLAPEVEPVVNVFVGIEPVDVVWEKHSEYWRAALGPQPGNGPWVVRLEVRDQKGGLLARDFVEVQRRLRRRSFATSSIGDLTATRE
jgi:hypothetical protein